MSQLAITTIPISYMDRCITMKWYQHVHPGGGRTKVDTGKINRALKAGKHHTHYTVIAIN